MMVFKVGAAYPAVPALQGAQKRLVVCIGREGRYVQLAWCEDLSVESVEALDYGREFAQASRPDGVYSISAACPVDAANAADVASMICNRKGK